MDVINTRSNLPKTTSAIGDKAVASGTDDLFDRVLKLVPAQVVAGYTALIAIIDTISTDSLKVAQPVALVACTILTVLALRDAGKTREPPHLQYLFSLLAFWAWAFAIRDPLVPFGFATPSWIPAFACVLVPLFGSYLIDVVDNQRSPFSPRS